MIYLDNNATTPITKEVFEAMLPYLTSEWGNPSSTYKFGSKLKFVIEKARNQVAELIGARQMESCYITENVVFNQGCRFPHYFNGSLLIILT